MNSYHPIFKPSQQILLRLHRVSVVVSFRSNLDNVFKNWVQVCLCDERSLHLEDLDDVSLDFGRVKVCKVLD